MSASMRSRPPALVLSPSPVSHDNPSNRRAHSPPPVTYSELRPPANLVRSNSKSQQLRAAVAAQSAHVASPQFRPDSMWSEGGADVVWSGQRNGVGGLGLSGEHSHSSSTVPPSPDAYHTPHRKFSSEGSMGEFADADEGYDSEGRSLLDIGGNTTLTTMSASGSGAWKSPVKLADEEAMRSAIPVRRMARPLKSPQTPAASSIYSTISSTPTSAAKPTFDENVHIDPPSSFDATSSYGHTRITSIGSSIWAGRGARHDTEAPPLPQMPHPYKREGAPRRDSGAETSSLYSEGAMSDWDRNPAEQVQHETNKFLERNGMVSQLDMQLSSEQDSLTQEHVSAPVSDAKRSEASPEAARGKSPRASPERHLADGTKVPPMPPIPARKEHHDREAKPSYPPRVRRAKGRRNRSPILSYADGEAEEQRLEQERELRERGGSSTDTSNMGIRLKKNSPAPWEMDGGEAFPEPATSRPSMDLGHMLPSRPSLDQLIPHALRSSGSRSRKPGSFSRDKSPGLRPSMDVAAPVHPLAASPRPPPSAFDRNENVMGLTSDMDTSKDILSSPSGGHDTSMEQRRTRTKSVTSSAQGVLKSMRLGSSSTASTPKKGASNSVGIGSTSIFAKALRKASGKDGDGNSPAPSTRSSHADAGSRSRKTSLNLSRGIGPEDYADRSASPPPPMPDASTPPLASTQYRGMPQPAPSTHAASSQAQGPVDAARSTLAAPPVVKHAVSMTSVRTSAKTDAGSPQSNGSSLTRRNSATKLAADSPSRSGTRSVDALSKSPRPGATSARKASGASELPPSPMQRQKSGEHTRDLSLKDLPPNGSDASSLSEKPPLKSHNSSPTATTSSPPAPKIARQTSSHSESSAHKPLPVKEPSDTPETSSSQTPVSEANITRALLTAAGAGMARLPSVGEHDGVPYKLISLEEARAQQAAQSKPSGRGAHSDAANDFTSLASAAPERMLGEHSVTDYSRDSRMRSKKSAGFLRRLAHKERGNGSSSRDLASLDAPIADLPHARSQTSLNSTDLEIPQLSVRPMSSMFNGFAPGLLDSMAELQSISEDHGGQDQHAARDGSSTQANVSRPSPAIRINSPESHASSSVHDFQDAQERTPTLEKGIARMMSPSVHSPQAGAKARAGSRTGTSSTPSALIPLDRLQTDSMHSDASSALGMVNGFPPTPEHSSDGFPGLPADLQSTSGQSLAVATRNRALQIEARMAELTKELSRLRAFAVDAGLAKSTDTASVASPASATSPPGGLPKVMSAQASQKDGETSVDSVESMDSALFRPLPQCDHCGCHCAEQKRMQSLQDLSILKGISVLDRGRALRPQAGENVGKFGSYLNR